MLQMKVCISAKRYQTAFFENTFIVLVFQKIYCLIFLQPKIRLISRLIYVYNCFHGCKFWHIFHELIFTDGENLAILCKLIIAVDKFVLLVFIVFTV